MSVLEKITSVYRNFVTDGVASTGLNFPLKSEIKDLLTTIVGAQTAVASEALASGDFVNVWNNGGVISVRKALALPGLTAHGFISQAYAVSAVVTILPNGLNTEMTGLTPGQEYWISGTVPGGVTSTAPAPPTYLIQRIGIALSATVMQVTFAPTVQTAGAAGAQGTAGLQGLAGPLASPVAAAGSILDYSFAATANAANGAYLAQGATSLLNNSDLTAAMALSGVAFACTTQRAVWDSAGRVAVLAASVSGLSHDPATGLTQNMTLEPASTNRMRNPQWAGITTGALTTNVAFATAIKAIFTSAFTSVTVATGTEYGMDYADLTGVVGGVDAILQVQFAGSTGATAIPTNPGDVCKLWGYIRAVSNVAGMVSPLWRCAWYTGAGVAIGTYNSDPILTTSLNIPATLTRLESGGTAEAVAPATTGNALPYIQITFKANQTSTVRIYWHGLEPGTVITSPIGAFGAWPFTRAVSTLTFTVASLPAGIWNSTNYTISVNATMPTGLGAIAKAGGSDVYLQSVSSVSGGALVAGTAFSTAPGAGSLTDLAFDDLVYTRTGTTTASVTINGGATVAATVPADISVITFSPPFPLKINRISIKPYNATGSELSRPFAQPEKIIGLEIISGSLYAVTSSGGSVKIIDGATQAVTSAEFLADKRIKIVRARPFSAAKTPFFVSDDGQTSIPIGPDVVHLIFNILAQSWAEGHYCMPPLSLVPVDGRRVLMPLMNTLGTDERYGSARGGSGANGYFDPLTLIGEESLVGRASLQSGFNAGETSNPQTGAVIISAFNALDKGDGPKLLFGNLAFSGTRAIDHGPNPTAATLGAGLTPPKGPYFDLDRALTKHVSLLNGRGKTVVVPVILSEIGWNDQFDAANNFASVFTTVAGQINTKILSLTGQPANPKIIAVQLCTRESVSPSKTDLNMVTLQSAGTVKIACPAYSVWPIGFYTDGLHDTAAGRIRKGEYIARAMLAEIYGEGWFPCMPLFLKTGAAGSIRRSGSQVQIDFWCPTGNLTNQDVIMGTPTTGGFSYFETGVGFKTVVTWSISGVTLTMNFASTVLAGIFGVASGGVTSTFSGGGNNYPVNNIPRCSIADSASPPNFPIICEVAVP